MYLYDVHLLIGVSVHLSPSVKFHVLLLIRRLVHEMDEIGVEIQIKKKKERNENEWSTVHCRKDGWTNPFHL